MSIKDSVIELIKDNSGVFKQVSESQYRIRCPICGDSQRNPLSAHMYIKSSTDIGEPMLYICFLCNAKGKIDSKFLKDMGIRSKILDNVDKTVFNRVSLANINLDILTGDIIYNSPQMKYIQTRIGCGFSDDDLRKFKIVWNMGNVASVVSSDATRHKLPNNFNTISFLSDNNTSLIYRTFNDNGIRWCKQKLVNTNSMVLYTISSKIDIFTNDKIYVNIAEGIFDIISIYKNINIGDNNINIAVLGVDYGNGIEHAVNKGFVGMNVYINVYLDSTIDHAKLIKQFKKYKWLFGGITLYKNIKSHDYGVSKENIKLISYIV